MRFEWDETKNRSNRAKHGITFEVAAIAFADPDALVEADPAEHEERWRLIGSVGGLVLVFVVFTDRGDDDDEIVRLISARRADGAERKRYDQAKNRPTRA